MSNNAHELSNRLLNALDNNYNVVDMQTVNEIISILEKFNITKELLETTRLGKHVNELRRKTSDGQLARRAKVLVKRWRDLVIPAHAALPDHKHSGLARAPPRLASPALERRVLSPAVGSPRPHARPAWGGYESDSQDVILVDDDPPAPRLAPLPAPLAPLAPLAAHKPLTPPVKRPPSPQPLYDDKKPKRDKKPKKRRGHGRAGCGTEASPPDLGGVTIPAPSPPPPAAPPAVPAVPAAPSNGERRRNGKKNKLDPYTAMVNRIPTAGAKKVKTTKELLEEIQSRGSKPPASPAAPPEPPGPPSPDVMLIEDCSPVKAESPLRNGDSVPPRAPPAPPEPLEEWRDLADCTCSAEAEGEEGGAEAECPAARRRAVRPLHVRALHHAYLPGVNGTRAPLHPHAFAVRPLEDPARAGLFASVVPLYKYSDYADDAPAKNLARVPLCAHLPWTEWAPDPGETEEAPAALKAETREEDHRTVERTRGCDGRALCAAVSRAVAAVPYDYGQLCRAPVLTLPDEEAAAAAALATALATAAAAPRGPLGRPTRPDNFAEWHECARLGELVALPYVVID